MHMKRASLLQKMWVPVPASGYRYNSTQHTGTSLTETWCTFRSFKLRNRHVAL